MYVIYPLVFFPAGRDCKGKKFHRKTPAGIYYKASNFAQELDFLHGALKITLSCITYKIKASTDKQSPSTVACAYGFSASSVWEIRAISSRKATLLYLLI